VGEVLVGGMLLVAALTIGTSIVVPKPLRTASQAVLIGGAVLTSWLIGRAWAEVALIGVLLTLVAITSMALEREAQTAQVEQRVAQQTARRRSELLTAARDIADLDVEEAAAVALRSLRRLGFDGAGVGVVRDGMVVPVRLDHLPATPGPMPVTEGVAGRAVRLRQTLFVSDYQQDPDRLPGRDHVGSMAATPIVIEDEVVGVLVGSCEATGPSGTSQREAIEVIAGHLGAAFDNRRRVENQRLLLQRMDRLDAMRTAFVDEVSQELRDPLTVVRSAGHTLRSHGDSLPPDARARLIDRLCIQAGRLQRIVEVVLDFSRFQATHRVSERLQVDLQAVLAPFLDRVHPPPGVPDVRQQTVRVHVDGELLRYALALLLEETGAPLALDVDAGEVVITIDDGLQGGNPLTRSLIEQLVLESGANLDITDRVTIRLSRFGMVQDARA